ncbi:MAG: tripartite tricarboxylate transporter substrate binding protein [Pseudomonadota bacterium]
MPTTLPSLRLRPSPDPTPASAPRPSGSRTAPAGALAGRLLATGAALALLVPAAATHAQPQAWPSGPIRLMVPFAPGSNNDTVGRLLGNSLQSSLGVPVVVENRPGAGGNLGAEIAARANPDGQMLLLGNSSHAISVTLYDKLGYDLLRDFAPVVLLGSAPYFLTVHPSLPAKTLKEVIALARARPEQLTIGSAGAGTYLWVELFQSAARIKATHVVYKGTPQVAAAVLSGEVSMGVVTTLNAIAQVKTGKLRGIAMTSERRSALLAEVPTVIESGWPVLEAATWYGLLAPAAVPREVIARLNAESLRALRQPELRERLDNMDIRAAGSTPEQFATFLRAEVQRWGKVVKDSGARPQ